MHISIEPNALYYGDCLEVMAQFPSEYVDLIYLDPPFNSDEKYNTIFKGRHGLRNIDPQIKAFDDTWTWNEASAQRVAEVKGAVANPASKVIEAFELFIPQSKMLSYTSYMAQRLFEMRRVLKPEGSIYLHWDPTASHYLKLVMDAIFGEDNFRNEIIWFYSNRWPATANKFLQYHDSILCYGKSESVTFNHIMIKGERIQKDLDKGWNTDTIPREGGRIRRLRIYDQTKIDIAIKKGQVDIGAYDEIVDQTHKTGEKPCPDVWCIDLINPNAKERLGYPTQKPLALLDRIIKASSDPDDLVLDPFCGCGTTIEAARKLNREAIGIDVLPFALRLINRYRIVPNGIDVMPMYGIPADMETATQLAKSDPYKFQDWAISLINGLASNPTKTGDDGVDGFGMLLNEPDNMDRKGIVVQVTGASGSQRAKFDRLQTTIRHHNAAMGILITLEAQPASRTWKQDLESVQMGETTYRPIQCFSVEEYFRNSEKVEGLLTLPPLTNPWTGKPMQKTLFD